MTVEFLMVSCKGPVGVLMGSFKVPVEFLGGSREVSCMVSVGFL